MAASSSVEAAAATVAGDGEQRSRPSRAPRRRQWSAYLYLLPAFLVLGAFFYWPLIDAAWISLWKWDGLTAATWQGFANYTKLASNPLLLDSFLHAFTLIVFYAVLPIIIALALAALMQRGSRLHGTGFFRTILFLPQVISSVVLGIVWVAIYAPDGVLNSVLSAVGLSSITRPWLADFDFALPAVGLIGTWVEIGLCMVLFMAGISQIPAEHFEAARMDGAGPLREFVSITLPALRPQIAVALTLTVIAALRTFDLVYVTTRGGPGNQTTVPSYQIWNLAINQNQVGLACALGVVLTLLLLLVTLLISRIDSGERG